MELSIVIVNFNNKDLLYNCLSSIFKATKNLSFEVIVADNNSQDNSPEMVTKEFPQVRLFCNKINLGFSKANNQGIEKARGKNILLLNSDTIVLEDSLNKMVNFLNERRDVAIVGCQMQTKEGRPYRSCFKFPNLAEQLISRNFFKKFFDISRFSLNYPDWNSGKIKEVDWLSGAALMIKKEVLEQIGMLDESLFIYFEDVDLCYRAKEAGFKICYLPQAGIIHIGQSTTQLNRERFEIEWHRSRLIYFKKHDSYLVFLVIKTLMLCGCLLNITRILFNLFLAPSRYEGLKPKLHAYTQIVKMGLFF